MCIYLYLYIVSLPVCVHLWFMPSGPAARHEIFRVIQQAAVGRYRVILQGSQHISSYASPKLIGGSMIIQII